MRDEGFVDLSPSEGAILTRLAERGSMTTAQLARLEDVTPQAMGATVRALVDRDLIHKQADTGDRRLMPLVLSARGDEVLQTAQRAINRQLGEAMEATLNEDQIAELGRSAKLLLMLVDVLEHSHMS